MFFNAFYLRKRYQDLEKDGDAKIKDFKEHLCKQLGHLKTQIDATSDETIKEMMPMILDRIRIYDELKAFNFLFELPNYQDEKSLKSKNKVMADHEKANKILSDCIDMLTKTSPANFNQAHIAKIFSEYLYKNKDKVVNEDLYHLLRYALTGLHAGGPVIKIMEILGQEETLKRIKLVL